MIIIDRTMPQGTYCKSLARAPTTSCEALTEWSKIFSPQATETYTSSETLMKQLTFVAGSTITYLKNVFPEENYKVEKLAGLEIRILKNKCDDELAQFMSTAMAGAFKAFEKKYLHQLAICFYDGACKLSNLVEYHMLEYSYKPDGASVSINSKGRDNVTESATITLDDVRESVTQTIRACLVAMSISKQPLPKEYDATVRLFYNEDAPEEYQAPGFVADTEDPLGLTYSAPLTLGHVETPYHKVVLSSYIKGITDSKEIITFVNSPVTNQPERPFSFQTSQSTRYNRSGEVECSSRLRCVCNNNEGGVRAASGMLVCLFCNRQQYATRYGVRHCCVACSDEDCSDEDCSKMPTDATVYSFKYCNSQQHATCYGVRHCCVACSDEDCTRTPTDAKLASIPADKRQHVAIIRQLVELCSVNVNVSASFLCDKLGIHEEFALKLMRLLYVTGIIERPPLATWKLSKIFHNQLENLSKAELVYALSGEEKDVVIRLVRTCARPFMQNSQSIYLLEKELNWYIKKIMSKVKTLNPENTTSNRDASILVGKDDNTEKPTAAVNDMDESRKRAEKRKAGDEELSTEDTAKKARGPKFILSL